MTSHLTSIRLAGGDRLQITEDELLVVRPSGDCVLRVPLREITSVRRGGKDIIVTRQEADPLSLVAATLDDARRLDTLVEDVLPRDRRQRQRRWRPKGHGRASS